MKIVGIGMPRTATYSLHYALKTLGYLSKHDIHNLDYKRIYSLYDKCYSIFDCFSDIPFCFLYDKIDVKFPNSKFILTERDMYTWLDSVEHLFKVRYNTWDSNTHCLHKILYGIQYFNRDNIIESYKRHHEKIDIYFKDREQDLLRIDIIENENKKNWEMLCGFLNKKIPNEEFPHKNTRNDLI